MQPQSLCHSIPKAQPNGVRCLIPWSWLQLLMKPVSYGLLTVRWLPEFAQPYSGKRTTGTQLRR